MQGCFSNFVLLSRTHKSKSICPTRMVHTILDCKLYNPEYEMQISIHIDVCTTLYLLKVRTCYLKYLNNGNPEIMKKYLGRQENNRDN